MSAAEAAPTTPEEVPATTTAIPEEVPATTTSTPSSKPKKALSAYWIYSSSVREEVTNMVKEKNGGKSSLADIAKEIGSRWAALPDDEKKVFEDKAVADKERHATEMKAYNEACDPVAALREKYADLIPKKPLSAYFLFLQDVKQKEKAAEKLKADGKEPSFTLVSKMMADMWKQISNEEKVSYQQEQTKLHAAFLEKEKVWKATPEFAEIEQAEKKEKERRKIIDAAVSQIETCGNLSPELSKLVAQWGGEEAVQRAKEEKKAAEKGGKKRSAQDKAATPEKAKPPAAKKARTSTKAATPEPAKANIDASVLAEAAKDGLQQSLENLASRPEVLASGKSSRAILEALKASGGLVNPAKRALLGQ